VKQCSADRDGRHRQQLQQQQADCATGADTAREKGAAGEQRDQVIGAVR